MKNTQNMPSTPVTPAQASIAQQSAGRLDLRKAF